MRTVVSGVFAVAGLLLLTACGDGFGINFENRTTSVLEVRVDHENEWSLIPVGDDRSLGFTDPPGGRPFLVIARIQDGPIVYCEEWTERAAHRETIRIENEVSLDPVPNGCS